MKRKLTIMATLILAIALVSSIVYADKHEEKENELSIAAEQSIAQNFPNAKIGEVKEEEIEIELYEVKLTQANGQESEVLVTEDGMIMEQENELKKEDLPFDLATVIPANAKVKEINSKTIYAVMAPVALETPTSHYEVEVTVDGKNIGMKLAEDGTIIKQKIEDDDDDDDDDDNDRKCKDDDDEHEDEGEAKIPFDQLPDAVKTTLTTEADNGEIIDIELKSKSENPFYEADVMINGNEVEIQIAPDGTLISKKIENGDDDDDKDSKCKDNDKD